MRREEQASACNTTWGGWRGVVIRARWAEAQAKTRLDWVGGPGWIDKSGDGGMGYRMQGWGAGRRMQDTGHAARMPIMRQMYRMRRVQQLLAALA
jgi:hypothetical protein